MRKKLWLAIIPIFIILLGVLFTVIGTKSSVPVMYMQKGNVMVKARGKEPMPILKIEESYYGCGYVTENGVVFKNIDASYNELGKLYFLSLSEKDAEPVLIDENSDSRVETVGKLTVYNGCNNLKIFNGEENIVVDTDVDDFCITPDKGKMLYWKRDGKVYVAKLSAKPESELLFDMERNYGAYPLYISPDLKQMIFNSSGELHSYKNGKSEIIAVGAVSPSIVHNTVYYERNNKVYSYCNGKTTELAKHARTREHFTCREGVDDRVHTYDRYFKKYRLASYYNRQSTDTTSYYLTGSDEPYVIEKGYHLACDGNYIYIREPEDNDTITIARYNITSKGLSGRKELLQGVLESLPVDRNKVIAKTADSTYLITGGKCKKLCEGTENRDYATKGNMVCWLTYEDTLYCNGKKICENVRNFDLRADGSLVWLTENDELYVKYKYCKPELIGNARGLYRVW